MKALSASCIDDHAVVSRLDMRRQLALELVVVEIRMQVGEDRAARLDVLDPGERVLDTEMARLRPVAQRIHDPDVEPGERRGALGRHSAEVAGVRKAPKPKA